MVNGFYDVVYGDIDSDGDIDLVFVSFGMDYVMFNNGDVIFVV